MVGVLEEMERTLWAMQFAGDGTFFDGIWDSFGGEHGFGEIPFIKLGVRLRGICTLTFSSNKRRYQATRSSTFKLANTCRINTKIGQKAWLFAKLEPGRARKRINAT